jgi:hypothetical protein
MSLLNLSLQTLRKAADLKEKIVALEKELIQILGSTAKDISTAIKQTVKAPTTKAPKKKGMSAAGRAKIAAAQKLRWSKIKAAKSVAEAKPVKKARKKMSAAAKAKLSAMAKARWAKVKAAGKKKL